MKFKGYNLVLILVMVAPWLGVAQQYRTWDGGGSQDNWSWWNNWGNQDPTTGNGFTFNGTGVTVNNDISNHDAWRIFFDAGATSTFTLSGNDLNLFDFSGQDSKIENYSTSDQIISLNVNLNFKTEINPINGDLIFNGTVDNGGNFIDVYGGERLTFNNTVSGTGGLAIKQGTTVEFAGNSGSATFSATFTGATVVENGTLVISDTSADPFDSNIILGHTTPPTGGDPATLTLASNSGTVTLDTDVEVRSTGGTKTINSNGTDGNEITGDITLNGDLNVNTDTSMEFSGQLSGGSKLIKDGADALTLSGDSSAGYTGNIEIDKGRLNIAEGGNVDSVGTIYVGNGTKQDISAELFISDLDGGTTVGTDIQVNPGNLNYGRRRMGGENTSGVNEFSGTIVQDGVELYSQAGGKVLYSGDIQDNTMSPETGNILVAGDGITQFSGRKSYQVNTEIGPQGLYPGETEGGTLELLAGSDISESVMTHIRNEGTLAGEGTAGDITVHDGGTISPGAINGGPGELSTSGGNVEFAGGGTYLFEINDFSDGITDPDTSAGTDWDHISIDGDLNITATAGDQFNIDISTIVGPSWGEGNTGTFDYTQDHLFTIATANNINGFSADKFNLDFGGFGDLNPYPQNWEVVVSVDGGKLQLRYTAGSVLAPEPSSLALFGMGLFYLIRTQRKQTW